MTLGFTDEAPAPVAATMLDDLNAAEDARQASADTPPSEPTPIRRRRQRSDAGTTRGAQPRNVGIADGVGDLPRRTRAKAAPPPPKKEELAAIITMAHTLAETMVSKKAHIEPGEADRIAEAMIPVLVDFGVVLVGKAVHLLTLAAVVVTVEGPIVYDVMMEARDRARATRAQNVTQTVNTASAPGATGGAEPNLASILGVEAGAPNM